jgi:hypothetical protein
VSRLDSALRIEGRIPASAVEALSRWIDRHPGSSVRVFATGQRGDRIYFHRVGADMVTRSSLVDALEFARS